MLFRFRINFYFVYGNKEFLTPTGKFYNIYICRVDDVKRNEIMFHFYKYRDINIIFKSIRILNLTNYSG